MKVHKLISYVLATVGGVGYAPLMPGTAGSLVAVVALFFVPSVTLPVYLSVLGVGTALAVYVAGVVERDATIKDPSFVVIDEVIGMAVAVAGVPHVWWLYVLALALFRLFDIFKPFPICKIDACVPGGLGIVLDDVLAGLIACGLMHLLIYLF